MAAIRFLVISSFFICAASALNWTSLTLLSNNVTIPACIGASVSFPWQYEEEKAEHDVDVEWLFTPIGQVQTLLASQVAGNFLVSPSAIQQVQYLSNAGLQMQQVTRADSGQYTVRVNVNFHGRIISYATSVNLLVAACTTFDCLAVKQTIPDSGVRTVRVSGRNITVYCDQTTDGGGWTVFQRRQDGSVNFNRSWTDYESGFGNTEREFWLGLENIHLLTSNGSYSLRIDLWDVNGTHIYAVYDTFYIDGASDNYRLHIANYSGTAGDSMLNTDNPHDVADKMAFSTYDRDNDLYPFSCASVNRGAWWYNFCQYSNLNGQYHADGKADRTGVRWYSYQEDDRSFVKAEMKMRPRLLN